MTKASLLRAGEGLPRDVQGAADPRFGNVMRIFAGLFPGHRFGGGALAVYIDGRPVVDVWTGWADRSGEQAVDSRYGGDGVLRDQGGRGDGHPPPGGSRPAVL